MFFDAEEEASYFKYMSEGMLVKTRKLNLLLNTCKATLSALERDKGFNNHKIVAGLKVAIKIATT